MSRLSNDVFLVGVKSDYQDKVRPFSTWKRAEEYAIQLFRQNRHILYIEVAHHTIDYGHHTMYKYTASRISAGNIMLLQVLSSDKVILDYEKMTLYTVQDDGHLLNEQLSRVSKYSSNKVFFNSESTLIASGYRRSYIVGYEEVVDPIIKKYFKYAALVKYPDGSV